MKDLIKSSIRKTLYHSRLLSRHYQSINSGSLTVVMFHRVLPISDPRWSFADMDWTVTETFFEECLVFFKKHYNVISNGELKQLKATGKPLPTNALLITFDDGWSDNLEYANAILLKHSLRATLFLTTGALDKDILSWQEGLYSAWRADKIDDQICLSINQVADTSYSRPSSETEIREMITALQAKPYTVKAKLNEIANNMMSQSPFQHQMLSTCELEQLEDGQFDLGTHGVEHEPMTQVESSHLALSESKGSLELLTKKSLDISSMSYPHSVCGGNLINQAIDCGYDFLFTGHECVNLTATQAPYILGRLNIEQADLQDCHGSLEPDKLAFYLFKKKQRNLSKELTY